MAAPEGYYRWRLAEEERMASEPTETELSSFWDHLEEARGALLRSLIYVSVGTAAAWGFRQPIFWALEWPAWQGARWARLADFNFRIFEPVGGLMLMLYASFVIGLVVAAPLWLWEILRFVRPGLTTAEWRFVRWLIPGATGLFVAGVLFCYFLAPIFCWFLLRFNVLSFRVAPEWTLGAYLRFLMQMLVISGLLFELPLVLMFLVWTGLVRAAALRAKWRAAVVIVLAVVALVTPTTDPFTMLAMSVPLFGLYALSLGLAVKVERLRRQRQEATPPPCREAASAVGEFTPPESAPSSARTGEEDALLSSSPEGDSEATADDGCGSSSG